jgi:vacuolar-type H+-ATPase subunit I/STV1
MKTKKIMMYIKIIFFSLFISMSFSSSGQATPIVVAADDQAQSSPLLEFLKEIIADDPSPFTNNLVSKALEDILKSFEFLSKFIDNAAANAEEKLKNEVEAETKKIEEELEEAIDKMIDDAIEEALKDDPEIVDDLKVEVDIDFSIPDPLGLLNQISIGSFPQKLSLLTPLALSNDTSNDVEFSLINTVTLADSRNVDVLRLNSSNIRISQIPNPPIILLFLVGFFAYLGMRIKQ